MSTFRLLNSCDIRQNIFEGKLFIIQMERLLLYKNFGNLRAQKIFLFSFHCSNNSTHSLVRDKKKILFQIFCTFVLTHLLPFFRIKTFWFSLVISLTHEQYTSDRWNCVHSGWNSHRQQCVHVICGYLLHSLLNNKLEVVVFIYNSPVSLSVLLFHCCS